MLVRLLLGTEVLLAFWLAGTFLVSVDGWLLATISQCLWGDVTAGIRLLVLTCSGNPPPEGCM